MSYEYIDVSDLVVPLTMELVKEEVRNDPAIIALAKELGYEVDD